MVQSTYVEPEGSVDNPFSNAAKIILRGVGHDATVFSSKYQLFESFQVVLGQQRISSLEDGLVSARPKNLDLSGRR